MSNVTAAQNNQYYERVPTFEERSKLGKDAFLKVLVTQLSNQDPLQPLEDREFISQMTQFSSLEQLTNVNEHLQQFFNHQINGSMASYANMIGQKVSWEETVDEETLSGEGIVEAVTLKNGQYILDLDDGTQISVDSVVRVSESTGSNDDTETDPAEEEQTSEDSDGGHQEGMNVKS
ncbi:flagellar hook assembly protein FlgD [Caldalkalibacillus salinus]|uniref:flagellar hook assembly protein FlgD n=1 Tax=Caldalkalibacillus salinus TaxID=2803787 RepID=UPI001922E475|nr:flagellar hook assembly protein FlgD [Caldalkalibacillus salinus]